MGDIQDFFKLVDYMKRQHPSIKFIFEVQANNNNFSFLGVKIWIENNTFTTDVFRKSTFLDVFISFDSFTQISYHTLIFWCFNFFFLWKLHNDIFISKTFSSLTDILMFLLIFVLQSFLINFMLPTKFIKLLRKSSYW